MEALYLNNYFNFHVCLSIHVFVRFCLSKKLPPVSAVFSQNVTNKSCLTCVKNEKYAPWVTIRPKQDCCGRGEAEVRIIDFKTTWSEFQMPSQTSTEHGEAELCIFYFKNTCSEFQKASQTATKGGKAKLYILNLKTT